MLQEQPKILKIFSYFIIDLVTLFLILIRIAKINNFFRVNLNIIKLKQILK